MPAGAERGIELLNADRLDEAIATFEALAEAGGVDSRVYELLAYAHDRRGDVELARRYYETSLSRSARDSALRARYAAFLGRHGDVDASIATYRRAIAEDPEFIPAYVNLGAIFQERGRLDEAVQLYTSALKSAPGQLEVHINLGLTLFNLRQVDKAREHLEFVLRQDPDNPAALANMGLICQELGLMAEADAHYRKLLRLAPSDGIRVRRAIMVSPLSMSVAQIRETREEKLQAIRALAGERLALADPVRDVGQTLFFYAYHGMDDRQLQTEVAALYERACPSLGYVAPHTRSAARAASRPRIGFISEYFFNHSIGYAYQGIVRRLDRDRFDVRLFLFGEPHDEVSREMAASADRCVVLPRDLARAREMISGEELDILFYADIGMSPLTYFLSFARLARVQCTSWGHPVTTGVRNVDYFVSTDYFEPPGAGEHYSERLHLLTGVASPSFFYRPQVPRGAGLRGLGEVADGYRVYFCPQALFKVHPDFDDLVEGILARDARARVVFSVRGGASDAWARQLLERMRAVVGGNADRIVFLPGAPDKAEYWQRLEQSSVILDTVHYGGGITSLEALSAGTPVVTLPGRLMRGRHTYGYYRRMGLTSCVARDAGQYVDLAVGIANDRELRQHLRDEILERNHVLYEEQAVVDQLGEFFLRSLADPTTG